MWICLCKSVTDRQVREAIEAGARTLEDLMRLTDAGTDCRDCLEALRAMLAQEAGSASGSTPDSTDRE
ncbi:MAG: (2Fe-2S)-binding protein [Candidatus Eisenbacteria bacterium]|uniref:Bacterioferritin-associated ferredoxin n=1 Tax=Eiseniibacteriota bacterium TaxID=2212470 RepID=A0A956RR30_UNCEI|nr:(2Fe-2S)-binding protein [Candidatus Eisenbacteria bacterium]